MMMRWLLVAAFVCVMAATSAAVAQLLLLDFGDGGIGAGGSAPGSNNLLLVDGTSYLLQTDGASKLCLAGGC